MEKHGRARQATDDITQCAKDAISKPDKYGKNTDIHS